MSQPSPDAPFVSEFIPCLAEALDLVLPQLAGHHKRVAYMALSIARSMGLPEDDCLDILLAGLVHDAGALTLKSRLKALEFETGDIDHAELGYRLLRVWPPLARSALLVRHHHARHDREPGTPLGARILCLADRVDVLIDRRTFILDQAKGIMAEIGRHTGGMFAPEAVDGLSAISGRESFWLDAVSPDIREITRAAVAHTAVSVRANGAAGASGATGAGGTPRYAGTNGLPGGGSGGTTPGNSLSERTGAAADRSGPDPTENGSGVLLADFARLFAQIIDFRSRFTATHSTGVGHVAGALARAMGLPEARVERMVVAGYLHDAGKLAVPAEVLNLPRSLSDSEFNLIKSHAYHTRRILALAPALSDIVDWASWHHEYLDGRGYPFHPDPAAIPMEARLVSLADVFTALREDRPYRAGMKREAVVKTLSHMLAAGKLDTEATRLLLDDFPTFDRVRKEAQEQATDEYHAFFTQNRGPG